MKTAHLQALLTISSIFIAQAGFSQAPYNTVSGTVWKESGTVNSIRDNGEKGVGGVMVTMLNASSGATVSNALTDTNGVYTLNNYEGAGNYVLQFDYPTTGLAAVQKRVGSNNAVNSSADPLTSQTDEFTIAAPTNLNTFGLGLSGQLNTITYSAVKLSDMTDWSATLTLPKADPVYGTVTKATIYIYSTEWHPYFGVENTSNSSVTTSPNSGIQVSVAPPVGTAINVINSILHTNTPLGAYDGTTDYAGASGRSWNNEFASIVAPPRVITLSSQLNTFRGVGTVSFPTTALGTVTLTGGGNLLSQISTHIGTGIFIVYEYAGGVLPVTMPVFTATAAASTVTLDWTTTYESNNDRFEVERSADGKNYQSVGSVKSLAENGNSSAVLKYGFKDYNVPDGRFFYRLRQMDKDGSANYSTVNIVIIGKGDALNVYPVPANKEINFTAKAGAVAKILDINGKVYAQVAFTATGNQTIDISRLPAGMYLLLLESDGVVSRQRINIIH